MFLTGVRVLDFSQYIPGPYASLRLSDFGAEVIKIESPSGDLARAKMGHPEEQGIVFEANNSNKQSITIDLKTEDGLRTAKALIEKADILIESFRPGVMKRLGLDYEKVKQIREDIIYCSISGYGQKGKDATLGSHDINYMALTGVLSQFKDKDGRPVHPTLTLADHLGGMAASESIIAALFAKRNTGKGAYIDISLLDSLLALMNNHFVTADKIGIQHGVTALAGTIVSYAIYETKDNRFVSLAALEEKFWENFCRAIHKPEWLNGHFSPTHATNSTYLEMQELFKSKTLLEWAKYAEQVDCCLTPVLEAQEVKEKYSSGPRQMVSSKGDGLQIATRYEPGLLKRRTKAPKLGEHTEQILKMIDF